MFLESASFLLKARQQIPLFGRLHESQKYLASLHNDPRHDRWSGRVGDLGQGKKLRHTTLSIL